MIDKRTNILTIIQGWNRYIFINDVEQQPNEHDIISKSFDTMILH